MSKFNNPFYVIFISFLLSIILAITSPLRVIPHYLSQYLIINIIIANSIIFTLIYFIENIMKFSIILIPWLFLSSLFEFYVAMSTVMEGMIGGYFTILLIFLEFYGMLYFSKKNNIILGLIYLVILGFIEVLVYNKLGM
ncbi:hypothetical protein EWF20_10770 [Sulfolobus sp. S-194]|uniref:hypothetical protein n=1 Tax=Sulfolobus sp. S-194 TaxID=2512240 RepID=UPI001437149B|nr:hypothetical protein [Sulfolobus sp. S-194]QIW24565.1 hypothetical protein EWF20_10770 [Sulfolobus sp. S-194]